MIKEMRKYNREPVDIIMPVFNQSECTRLAVETIGQAGYPFRLIVVDNGSTGKDKAALTKFAKAGNIDVLIRNKSNAGFSAAVNQGVEASRSKYFVITNNDVVYTHWWLWKLVRALDGDESIAVSSPLRLQKEPPGTSLLEICAYQYEDLKKFPRWETDEKKGMEDLLMQVDAYVWILEKYFADNPEINPVTVNHGMVPFFCVAVRREHFEKLGRMDKDFGVGLCEDKYFCDLVKRGGLKLAVSRDCFVYHFMSQTLIKMFGSWEAIKDRIRENSHLAEVKLGISK